MIVKDNMGNDIRVGSFIEVLYNPQFPSIYEVLEIRPSSDHQDYFSHLVIEDESGKTFRIMSIGALVVDLESPVAFKEIVPL